MECVKRNILETLKKKLKDEYKTIILDECIDELVNIIENNIVCREFSSTMQSDIMRYNEHREELLRKKKIFEIVALNDQQRKRKIGPDLICSYKYKKKGKNNKNIRCLYLTDKESGWNFFLKAFIEKDNKGKRGDYKIAIDKAIERYNQIYEKD